MCNLLSSGFWIAYVPNTMFLSLVIAVMVLRICFTPTCPLMN